MTGRLRKPQRVSIDRLPIKILLDIFVLKPSRDEADTSEILMPLDPVDPSWLAGDSL